MDGQAAISPHCHSQVGRQQQEGAHPFQWPVESYFLSCTPHLGRAEPHRRRKFRHLVLKQECLKKLARDEGKVTPSGGWHLVGAGRRHSREGPLPRGLPEPLSLSLCSPPGRLRRGHSSSPPGGIPALPPLQSRLGRTSLKLPVSLDGLLCPRRSVKCAQPPPFPESKCHPHPPPHT